MKITWFGHAAFRVDIGGSVVLIDPFLSQNPSFRGDLRQAVAGVSHIVLTHGHGDHLGDTVPIAKDSGATVVANADIVAYLGGQGLTRCEAMNIGGTVRLGALSVSMVNAIHSSSIRVGAVSQNLGNPAGIILKAAGERTLYHMGDTDIFGDMALVEELHAPKIGLVPIGDRFTMGGATAALACRRYFDFETIVPCHFGTFPLIDQTPDLFLSAMGDQAGRVRVGQDARHDGLGQLARVASGRAGGLHGDIAGHVAVGGDLGALQGDVRGLVGVQGVQDGAQDGDEPGVLLG